MKEQLLLEQMGLECGNRSTLEDLTHIVYKSAFYPPGSICVYIKLQIW